MRSVPNAAFAIALLSAACGAEQAAQSGSQGDADADAVASSGTGGASGAVGSGGTGTTTSSATTRGSGGAGGMSGTGGAAPAPQIIYVNFDGGTISDCDSACSDAPSNQSWAISAHFGETEVTFAPYADAAGRTLVTDDLESAFSPYNVIVTTTRPATGPYTMVIVSPTPGPNHGVAPLDCLNGNPNDIAFVYNLESSAKWSAPQQIARSAAHELGHSFGLEHVVSGDDFMQWASVGDAFTISSYDYDHPSGHDCIAGDEHDAPSLLLQALGPAL